MCLKVEGGRWQKPPPHFFLDLGWQARQTIKVLIPLTAELKILKDRKSVEQLVSKQFGLLDFENGIIKNSFIQTKHLPKSEKAFIDATIKRQVKIGDIFLKHKNLIHSAEDPKFLDDLSDIFDIRNWNLVAFKSESADFTAERTDMNTKLLGSNKLFEDSNDSKVEVEFQTVLQLVYEANQSNPKLLSKCQYKTVEISYSQS